VKPDPEYWFHLACVPWVVFIVYWFMSAIKLKAVKKREPGAERLVYVFCMFTMYMLMFNDLLGVGWLGRRYEPESARIGAIGVALSFAGIALAIWARWHLGQNWSATVTLKEGHELIRSGPYGRIRHPIYTGMLLALVGTAVALGQYRGLLSLGIAFGTLFAKARKEERFLVGEFGDRFREHVARTGMFLPKVT